jgi:hypothetical protein
MRFQRAVMTYRGGEDLYGIRIGDDLSVYPSRKKVLLAFVINSGHRKVFRKT